MEGVELRDDGTEVLRIRVRAVPDRGRANEAVIALLAKLLGLPKSSFRLASGETSRFKTIVVSGDADDLEASVMRLAAATK